LFANSIKIIVKVQDEIITNVDIDNEKKYLTFLNPKLKELNNSRINEIAKNSLIREIIKKNELEKIYDFEKTGDLIDVVEKNFLESKNISNKTEFIQILNKQKLNYETIKKKLQIEALWNQFIYNKYAKNIRINENGLRESVISQFKDKNKKFEYNLSEIFFTETQDKSLNETLKKIISSIEEIGFENTANIYSISSTSKNGGLIGWVNELQISEKIKKNILNLNTNEISKPIRIENGYLLVKVNERREFKQKINLENQLKELINKETNRQLNSFSIIYYKRLRKNIRVDEI
tara:strand:+ start:4733 stop:5608 length:876 start_codon:yes stop_codon:yes gene_type:complete